MSKYSLSREKISLYLVFIFFISLTFLFCDIPFFWDGVNYISLPAYYILDSHFISIIPPLELDSGNFPFYGFYMALWWKIFGKSLLVSHIAILPLLLGITWEYYRLAKKFLSEKWIPFAMALLVLEPTFITQSIIMGHDLFLVYFSLLSINALLDGKKYLYAFALCLLAFHHLKGIPAAVSLIFFYFCYNHFVIHKKIQSVDWLIHVFPAILWGGWIYYHKYITGWYLLSPLNTDITKLHFSLFGLKRIVLEIWQIIDFGRVFLWLFLLFVSVFYWKRICFLLKGKTILLLLFFPLSLSLLFYAMIYVSLSYRYYMVTFLIVHLCVTYLMMLFIHNKIFRLLLAFVFCIGLITGNFWIYGGGFSNGWDSSLKVLPYFKLINEMRHYVRSEKINPTEIGTKFPLHHDTKYSEFSEDSFHFTDMDTSSLENYKYILLSNVSNLFTVEEKNKLNSEWTLINKISRGQIDLKLFRNPHK